MTIHNGMGYRVLPTYGLGTLETITDKVSEHLPSVDTLVSGSILVGATFGLGNNPGVWLGVGVGIVYCVVSHNSGRIAQFFKPQENTHQVQRQTNLALTTKAPENLNVSGYNDSESDSDTDDENLNPRAYKIIDSDFFKPQGSTHQEQRQTNPALTITEDISEPESSNESDSEIVEENVNTEAIKQFDDDSLPTITSSTDSPVANVFSPSPFAPSDDMAYTVKPSQSSINSAITIMPTSEGSNALLLQHLTQLRLVTNSIPADVLLTTLERHSSFNELKIKMTEDGNSQEVIVKGFHFVSNSDNQT
ncbi:hypothetical protein [Parashewanella curva]|nr:hypothetical protein [Parashewanella curva]